MANDYRVTRSQAEAHATALNRHIEDTLLPPGAASITVLVMALAQQIVVMGEDRLKLTASVCGLLLEFVKVLVSGMTTGVEKR